MDAQQQARTFFQEGLAHFQAGRLAQAERSFDAALSLAPGRPSVLTNLGVVRLQLGRPDEAAALLQEALAQEPGNLEALGHGGAALAECGRLQEAVALFDRAIAIDPHRAQLWTWRGSALRELGQLAEAAASFRRALEEGGDAELHRYYLASVEAQPVPPAPPRAYVEALFDSYAGGFDEHVVAALNYEAPRRLTARLAARAGAFTHALDLGCGTGLCGPLLRPLAQRLTGVDLSARMLEKAAALGVYDELQHTEVQAFLAGGDAPFDAVVAADVFIYVGALEGVFAQVARRMPAGGAFCFTLETSPQQDLLLRPSLRYAHSEAYVRRLAADHGFEVDAIEHAPVRHDQGQPVAGQYVWLRRL